MPYQALILIGTACLALAACSSIGPKTMDRDHLDYSRSVGNNWKNQMLTNLVRLRYVDMPVFVDVGQIVAGYSLETQLSAEIGFGNSFTGGDAQGLKGGGRFTDRPTITYMPKTGEDFLRSLLEPVEPKALLSLVLAGYSSELLFTWAVESINGLKNYSIVGTRARSADPEFIEYVQLMQELQSEAAISFEIENDPKTGHDIIMIFQSKYTGSPIKVNTSIPFPSLFLRAKTTCPATTPKAAIPYNLAEEGPTRRATARRRTWKLNGKSRSSNRGSSNRHCPLRISNKRPGIRSIIKR